MKLNEIRDNAGATKNRKRIGRGLGSGVGKTGGRGYKGQKSRSGVSIKGFEGGQMPLYRRLPKRGFNNIFAKEYAEVSLGKLQEAIDSKKLDAKGEINCTALVEAGVARKTKHGVKLLGNGELKTKVTLRLAHATKSATTAVEKAGGKITTVVADRAEETAAAKEKKRAKRAAGVGKNDKKKK